MIKIDLSTGDNGQLGGEITTIQREYQIITSYLYKLLIKESPRNHDIFFNMVKEAVKNADRIDFDVNKKVSVDREEE